MLRGVSWMPEPGFRLAVEPVIAEVEAVEWTLDAGFGRPLPPSTEAVLTAFGAADRLYGHGLGYSPLSAGRPDVARAWLAALRAEVATRRYRRLAEHFGFCTGGPFAAGAPLPMPRTAAVLAAGRDRLLRLRDAAGVPVGLENLALALCGDDALGQGEFVQALLEPVDGYVHLDLHNLWCQSVNFGIRPDRLLASWPLDRVRVVHVSGGAWVDGIRRDTHDGPVPDEVWALLGEALPRLAACEVVLLERIGSAFGTDDDRVAFRADWSRLRREVSPG